MLTQWFSSVSHLLSTLFTAAPDNGFQISGLDTLTRHNEVKVQWRRRCEDLYLLQVDTSVKTKTRHAMQ